MNILDFFHDKLETRNHELESVRIISQIISECGGVSALIEKFNIAGTADIAKSWISPGIKKTITAKEIQDALGEKIIKSVATKYNFDYCEISSLIAKKLPILLDKLTPLQIPIDDPKKVSG
jgi:uncharacterized protein YidB (DUF937 family)